MDSEGDVARRWAAGLREAAARAYSTSHGAEPPEPRPTRWRLDARTAVTAAVAVAVLAAWAWWGLRPDGAPVTIESARPSASAAAPVVVHVSGEVGRPGLVELAGGGRVADAIAAAGGLSEKADDSSVNLARPVVDGEHIVVRGAGDGPSPTVSLNAADAEDLERLPGVGPVLAARIVADREANGPFVSLDDLGRVSGVGPAILAGLDGIATT